MGFNGFLVFVGCFLVGFQGFQLGFNGFLVFFGVCWLFFGGISRFSVGF